jgi:predicted alpha/beta hydrolase family esterase
MSNMNNAIIVPGRPDKEEHYDPARSSNSEDHWYSWLKRRLILKDIHAVVIEPPFPFRPRYDEWKKEFERFDVTPDTILVGHSCGGGFLVRYLSENKNIQAGKVVLVAPWLNPENNPESDTADFFDFEIDPDFPSRTKGVALFVSSDDMRTIIDSVDILKQKVKDLQVRQYTDKQHFTLGDLGTTEFPDLLSECLN